MAKLTGVGGSVTVSSTAYPVKQWQATTTNDVQEVTDSASGGWTDRLAATKSVEITFTAWFGGVAGLSNVFANGASVAATLGIGSGAQTITGTFIVSSVSITNDAKTPVEFQCTALSTGSITFPT